MSDDKIRAPDGGPENLDELSVTPESHPDVEQPSVPPPAYGLPFFMRGPDAPESEVSVEPPPPPPRPFGVENKPEGMTWGDYKYGKMDRLKPRHKEFARLLFLGKTNNEICEALGYTVAACCMLGQQQDIRAEVARLQERAFDLTIQERLKEMGPAAMNVIEDILLDESERSSLRQATAIWTIEKLTGKAKQEVDLSSSSLTSFFELLDQQKPGAPAPPQYIDVTPSLGSAADGTGTDAVTQEAGTQGPSDHEREKLQAQPVSAVPASPVLSKLGRWVKENL